MGRLSNVRITACRIAWKVRKFLTYKRVKPLPTKGSQWMTQRGSGQVATVIEAMAGGVEYRVGRCEPQFLDLDTFFTIYGVRVR